MGPHLVHCHLIIANVANLSTRSKLGHDHPIRRVMKIFTYNTSSINYAATLFLTKVCKVHFLTQTDITVIDQGMCIVLYRFGSLGGMHIEVFGL